MGDFDDPEEHLRLVPRSEWATREPKFVKNLALPAQVIRLTHTGTDICFDKQDCISILQDLQSKHMDIMNLPDIQWNFMIGGDGTVFEGRGWHTEGYKNSQLKKQYGDKIVLEVTLIGNFKDLVNPMEMDIALRRLVRHGKHNKMIIPKCTVTALVRDCSIFSKRKR